MTLHEAVELISGAQISSTSPQAWADLGCGTGLFTRALTARLPEEHTVYAVDKKNVLSAEAEVGGVIFKRADFEKDDLRLSNLDGLLLANSLHYIADQPSCLQRLNTYLNTTSGRYILIEYDSSVGNPWVPFPIPFRKARPLFAEAGFSCIEKIGERKSAYQQGNLYACVISR